MVIGSFSVLGEIIAVLLAVALILLSRRGSHAQPILPANVEGLTPEDAAKTPTKELMEKIWLHRAKRLGISVEEAKAGFEEDIIQSRMREFRLSREEVIARGLNLKPLYLIAAEQMAARRGITAEELLREYDKRLKLPSDLDIK
ncbi:MAG TPA: hypothetical protein VNG29_00760 [Candidatus Paceibacterota bacterium]|nr:hypothetical protein [Candidatus Paceibacterota bacterium]